MNLARRRTSIRAKKKVVLVEGKDGEMIEQEIEEQVTVVGVVEETVLS